MPLEITQGDLLDQDVEVIVNAWNRNFIPWWLLIPAGVSRAIRKRSGAAPFRELRRHGLLPLGGAVVTGSGRLPFRAIIHVAGIDALWRSSERAIRDATRNALTLAHEIECASIAFPLIGAGTGGVPPHDALRMMQDEILDHEFAGRVRIVRYQRERKSTPTRGGTPPRRTSATPQV